jgi:hypothetical protein
MVGCGDVPVHIAIGKNNGSRQIDNILPGDHGRAASAIDDEGSSASGNSDGAKAIVTLGLNAPDIPGSRCACRVDSGNSGA